MGALKAVSSFGSRKKQYSLCIWGGTCKEHCLLMVNTLEAFKSQGLLCYPKQIIINHAFWKQSWYNKQKEVIYQAPHTWRVPFLQLRGTLKFRTWRLSSPCCKSLLSTSTSEFLLEIKPSQTSYQCVATLFIPFHLIQTIVILDWFMLW